MRTAGAWLPIARGILIVFAAGTGLGSDVLRAPTSSVGSTGGAAHGEANNNISCFGLSPWVDGAIRRFRSEVHDSRVVELQDTNHYVYVVDEALVVRDMRQFFLHD